jgi:CRISPR-associated exonuclease Cas4
MEQESTSDLVALGRHVHETSYDRRQKEVLIDGAIRIDGVEAEGKGMEAIITVHEVKKSRGAKRAQRLQLLYYLYVLRQKGLKNIRGVLDYPLERRREVVPWTPAAEEKVEAILQRVEKVRTQPVPPKVEVPMSICKKCAYQELCWG